MRISIRDGLRRRHLEAFLAKWNETIDSLFIAFGTQDTNAYAKRKAVELDVKQCLCRRGAEISSDKFSWNLEHV